MTNTLFALVFESEWKIGAVQMRIVGFDERNSDIYIIQQWNRTRHFSLWSFEFRL